MPIIYEIVATQRTAVETDKTALKTFIDKASGLEVDKDKCTKDTWVAFETELNEDRAVYEDENAMQEEVNNAYNELVTAFLNLRLIPDKSLLEDLINQAEDGIRDGIS